MKEFIGFNLGRLKEFAGITTSAGAGDADKLIATDAGGKIDATFMPTGYGADIQSTVTSENLAAGDLVNIWNDGGTPKARKADASTAGKEANGFVLAVVTAPAAANVYLNGTISGLSGLTPGARQYLDDTAGLRVETAFVSGSGKVHQKVGTAVSATEMRFDPDEPVTLL